MNVYVESNFVLELALEQEQSDSCEELIRLALAGFIQLLIPAFSLAEPHLALAGKKKARSKLENDLKAHVAELGRSKQYRDELSKFNDLATFLATSLIMERAGLQRTTSRLIAEARIIPLDSSILRGADGLTGSLELSVQDSVVLASILSHLAETKPEESCFLNRNTNDFDNPEIREMLDSYGCRFFGRFDHGLHYIKSRLTSTSD